MIETTMNPCCTSRLASDEPPRELLCAWCQAQIEACERAAREVGAPSG